MNPKDFFDKATNPIKEVKEESSSEDEEIDDILMKRPQVIQRRNDTATTKDKLK